MSRLKDISIINFTSEAEKHYPACKLTYQLFGKELNSAPVILVNHALTGNSDVAGEQGWWKVIVGSGKLIDTDKFTVLAFDIPGNGYEQKTIEYAYDEFTARDIANLFGLAVNQLGIDQLYAAVGSSLGGGIAWEMSLLFPDLIEHLVPIASDWRASDWILAHNKVQFQILNNSSRPLHDARMMAMMFYRTPASFEMRFNRTINEDLGIYNIESWLLHHGKKLEQRFSLHAYKVMTHLLSSVDITRGRGEISSVLEQLKAKVTMVGINTDLFFIPEDNIRTAELLTAVQKEVAYKEITSIHGHDAFLIEFDQLVQLLDDVFQTTLIK